MSAKTFQQLTDEIRGQIWAAGEMENLILPHTFLFKEAMGDISMWVDCEQQNNVDVVDFCKTFFRCGMTVLNAPHGVIRRLYTVANGDFCDPVFYRQVSYEELLSWSQQLVSIVQANKAAKLPLGFSPADPSTDSKCGRARQGLWAIYRGNIYIGPWIQSMESVVFEWDGLKKDWSPADVVTDTVAYKKAVKLYVQYAHERDYGSMERAAQFKVGVPPGSGGYDQALADLMRQCRENTKVRPSQTMKSQPYSGWMAPLWLEKGLPPGQVPPSIIAHIGNFYGQNQDMNNVGVLVREMGPNLIVGSGLIAGAPTDSYDDTVGKWFYDFMEPYLGTNGAGSTTGNAFWPAPAPSDWAKDGCQTWKAWFPTGQKTHYAKCFTFVEFFFLDSSVMEPDGNWPESTQAKLLQVQLAMSTAPWKVVVLSDCAYGSVRNNPMLQWPFRAWGVNMLLSSGAVNYERLNVNGLAVINNGLGGGGTIEPVVTPDANMVFTYSAARGAARMTADATSLTYQFVNVDGVLVDTITLGTPAGQSDAPGATVIPPGSGTGWNPILPPVGGGRLHGAGDPADSLGQPGDTYVDDVSGAFYWKSATGWKP